jgi:hypothetical protein
MHDQFIICILHKMSDDQINYGGMCGYSTRMERCEIRRQFLLET